jgi:large subunit ribosomal protein L13
VYVGDPHDYGGQRLDGTGLDRLSNIRFTSLGEVSEELGASKTW